MCFEDFGLKVEEIEEKTGLSKTTINHRLNMAKLDKETLVEKAEDKEFQLSITDLYTLEKVKDINTRNKILKEASDSRDLANRARQAARQELQERNKAKLIEECEKLGINKAPEGVYYFSNGWEEVKRFYLDEKGHKVEMKEVEGLFYTTNYNSFSLIKKEKKQKEKKEGNRWKKGKNKGKVRRNA